MQLHINSTLEIIPVDQYYAVRAEAVIQKQSRKDFIKRTFLIFVLEIRTAMDDNDIKALKNFVIETCDDLIQMEGIDNIGFVINENYHTIRNPNVQGIKDLLNTHARVGDTKDISKTLICLSSAIKKQTKKMEQSKLSIVWFSSNVAQNILNPVKPSYRLILNMHVSNYQKYIARLRKEIYEHCVSCDFYALGYIKSLNNNKVTNFGISLGGVPVGDKLDTALFYQLRSISTNASACFNVCQSYQSLSQKFKQTAALLTYSFSELLMMVPIRTLPWNDDIIDEKRVFNMEQVELEEDEELNEAVKQIEKDGEDDFEEEEQIEFLQNEKRNVFYTKLNLYNYKAEDSFRYGTGRPLIFPKDFLDLMEINDSGYHIFKEVAQTKEFKFPVKQKIMKKRQHKFIPQYTSNKVNFHEADSIEQIQLQTQIYKKQLNRIISSILKDILTVRKRYVGTYKKVKLFQNYLEVNEEVQNHLRHKLFKIEEIVKQMYETIFKDDLIKTQKAKRQMFECYSSVKVMIDTTKQVFVDIFKKQIKNQDFNKLSLAINYTTIKGSLKRKLIKRINGNPNMVNQAYQKVQAACQNINVVNIQAKYSKSKSEVGNCMYTYKNFATALKDKDCIGVVFQLERPDSAIADPGRIRIREVSPLVCTVSKFFERHLYMHLTTRQQSMDNWRKQKIENEQQEQKYEQYCPSCGGPCYFFPLYFAEPNLQPQLTEQKIIQNKRNETTFGLENSYSEMWDYWDRVQSKVTFYGIMPLFVCEENWSVAKHIMKPCMGWNACGQPLGYTYSQMQTIPFMLQSSFIRTIQELKYQEQQIQNQNILMKKQHTKQFYDNRAKINIIKHKRLRLEDLQKHVGLTCKAIMKDMSSLNLEQPLNRLTIERYQGYKDPINRTVDVISNNSMFLSQIYSVIELGMMQKPSQEEFHQFFKRLVEQELRRQTDGWNQEQVEQKFINKLLNAKVQAMDKPKYVVMMSEYLDKFELALKGGQVLRTQFQIQRQALEMLIKQNNKFNETQKMTLIEYKRLYQNRVLWLWYIRFRMYQEVERVAIHKWKCLNLTNSYQLFTMIIQNKKQRKNWKRREAIIDKVYADPFDYYKSREFLEGEFVKMRNKKQSQNIVLLNAEKYNSAAKVFSRSKDLRQSAGAILNMQIGKEINYYFQQIFHNPSFIEQKLRMFLLGQFQGVMLFKHGWKMSRKRMRKIEKSFPKEFQKYKYMF